MHAAKRIKTFSYWTLLDAWLGVYAGRPQVRRGVGDKARGPGRGNRRDDTPRVALIARVRRALSTQSHHQNSHDKPKKQMKATDTFDPTGRRRDPGAKATGVPRARRQVQAHALAVLWPGGRGRAGRRGSSTFRGAVAAPAACGRDCQGPTCLDGQDGKLRMPSATFRNEDGHLAGCN